MIAALFALAFAVAFGLIRLEHRESIECMPTGPNLEARDAVVLKLAERVRSRGGRRGR